MTAAATQDWLTLTTDSPSLQTPTAPERDWISLTTDAPKPPKRWEPTPGESSIMANRVGTLMAHGVPREQAIDAAQSEMAMRFRDVTRRISKKEFRAVRGGKRLGSSIFGVAGDYKWTIEARDDPESEWDEVSEAQGPSRLGWAETGALARRISYTEAEEQGIAPPWVNRAIDAARAKYVADVFEKAELAVRVPDPDRPGFWKRAGASAWNQVAGQIGSLADMPFGEEARAEDIIYMPPPEGFWENLADFSGATGVFLTELVLARKFLPADLFGRDIAAMGIAGGSRGAAMGAGMTLVNQLPYGTAINIISDMTLFAGIDAAMGYNAYQVVMNAFLPFAIHGIGVAGSLGDMFIKAKTTDARLDLARKILTDVQQARAAKTPPGIEARYDIEARADIETRPVAERVTETNIFKLRQEARSRGVDVDDIIGKGSAEQIRARLNDGAEAARVTPSQDARLSDIETRATGVRGGIEEVAGTGEVKPRGTAVSMERRAIENNLADTIGDLPEYRTVNMAEQSKLASDIFDADIQRGYRIALGQESVPPGLLKEAVLVAAERVATRMGDVEMIRDLANSPVVAEITTKAQGLRMLAEADPASPAKAIRSVEEVRRATAEKRGGEKVRKMRSESEADIDRAVAIEHRKSSGAWIDLVNRLIC